VHVIFLLPKPCPPFLSPVARKLIEMLSEQGDTVFDPFCGSGTVTTEAVRLGRHAIGFDINPLALFIAEVKATPIMPQRLWQALAQIESSLQKKTVLHTSAPAFHQLRILERKGRYQGQ
jgi:site-specific DNA-adenine methylase